MLHDLIFYDWIWQWYNVEIINPSWRPWLGLWQWLFLSLGSGCVCYIRFFPWLQVWLLLVLPLPAVVPYLKCMVHVFWHADFWSGSSQLGRHRKSDFFFDIWYKWYKVIPPIHILRWCGHWLCGSGATYLICKPLRNDGVIYFQR